MPSMWIIKWRRFLILTLAGHAAKWEEL